MVSYRKECSKTKESLSKLDQLFQTVTSSMFNALEDGYREKSFESVESVYNQLGGSEKDFLSLILLQGKNNVSEVRYPNPKPNLSEPAAFLTPLLRLTQSDCPCQGSRHGFTEMFNPQTYLTIA